MTLQIAFWLSVTWAVFALLAAGMSLEKTEGAGTFTRIGLAVAHSFIAYALWEAMP